MLPLKQKGIPRIEWVHLTNLIVKNATTAESGLRLILIKLNPQTLKENLPKNDI